MEYRKQLRIDGIRTERLVVKKKLRDKSGCCVWLITQKTIHVKNNRRVREELQMLHSEHYRLQKIGVVVDMQTGSSLDDSIRQMIYVLDATQN